MKRLTKKILQKNLMLAAIASLIFLFAPQINISAQNNTYLETGKKLAREGLYKEAIVELQKSNALIGENAEAYTFLGFCFNRLKQPEEAIPNLRKSITLKPDYGWAYVYLSEAFYNTGRNEEALVVLREAARLLPNDAQVTTLLSKVESAIAQNKTGRQNNVNNNSPQVKTQTDEYYDQGLALFRKEDYKKAIKSFEQSLKVNPNNPDTFYNLGSAYYNTSQFTKSAKAYREVLRLNPNHPTAKQDLADAQTKMKEEKAAQEAAWAKIAEGMKNNRSTQTAPPRRNEDNADEETAAPRRGNAQNVTGRNRTSPEGAPTEEEVKQAIEKFSRELVSYRGSTARVVSWDSPIQILSGRKDIVNTDPGGDQMMYPVKVDYTVTVDDTYTTSWYGGALGFHKNAFGEWKFYTLENYQSKRR